MSSKYKLYTNSDFSVTIRVYEGQTAPDGFVPGCGYNKNKKLWNSGLTADIDDRVKKNTDACHETRKSNGTYKAWNSGLTKETDDRVLRNYENTRKTVKDRYGVDNISQYLCKLDNYHVWDDGLTKETNASLKHMSETKSGKKLTEEQKINQKKKEYETRKRNGTLGNFKSSCEIKLEKKLIELFGEDNVEYNYFNVDEYPFKCDFYIKCIDLYIELNADPRHLNHPFDKNNMDDVKLLENLLMKNDRFSRDTAYTWSDLDCRKRETAINNDLNFMQIYQNKRGKDIVYTHWKQCEDNSFILKQINELL